MNCNKVTEAMLFEILSKRYDLCKYNITRVHEHEGGRNVIYLCHSDEKEDVVLRVSNLPDRTREDYLAELEFVRYLYENGACVANVLDSISHNLLEQFVLANCTYTVCMFQRAKGKLLVENHYRYREGVPLCEYFIHCGQVLGKIHQLSKEYVPLHKRYRFVDRFDEAYLDRLIPARHTLLLDRFHEIMHEIKQLDRTKNTYGTLHFDFNDSNYSIDFDNGAITVYDFDNSCIGFYLYDLADLWTHGVGWVQFEPDANKRRTFMESYFSYVLKGYRSETSLEESSLQYLPLFIDATILENIVDQVESMLCEDAKITWDEDLIYFETCLTSRIPYRGFFDPIYSTEHPFE